jgi:D-alanyl-lipoteichoic acid acyltransferase DltB (MBOAT superfamily)
MAATAAGGPGESRACPGGTLVADRHPSRAQRLAVTIGSLVAVILCCDDGRVLVAISLFMVLAGALTLARALVPERARRGYLLASAAVLTAAVLFLRKSPALVLLAEPGRRALAPAALMNVNFSVLGLSYCYLRAIYGLLDPRPWDASSLFGYYLFAPTFFSGPVMSPGEFFAPAPRGREALHGGIARLAEGILRIAASQLLLQLIPLRSAESVATALRTWPAWMLWLGVFSSGVWLYLNFSGYSAVFIGLSTWMGVRPPENFDHPYAATDLTAFWQRWHISLGLWLRAHVYDPLSRRALTGTASLRTAASLILPIVTMAACGAWHMLTPAFLLWGALHGVGIAVHAAYRRFAAARLPQALRGHWGYHGTSWVLTHAFVGLSWALFLPPAPLPLGTRLAILAALLGRRT